jgi:hypothetical protein
MVSPAYSRPLLKDQPVPKSVDADRLAQNGQGLFILKLITLVIQT